MTFGGLGYAFGHQLEDLVARVQALGVRLGFAVVLVGGRGLCALQVCATARRFLRELRISRITAAELAAKMAAGEDLAVVDLRHSVDFEADPETIPGALHLSRWMMSKQRAAELPRQQEVILYCT